MPRQEHLAECGGTKYGNWQLSHSHATGNSYTNARKETTPAKQILLNYFSFVQTRSGSIVLSFLFSQSTFFGSLELDVFEDFFAFLGIGDAFFFGDGPFRRIRFFQSRAPVFFDDPLFFDGGYYSSVLGKSVLRCPIKLKPEPFKYTSFDVDRSHPGRYLVK